MPSLGADMEAGTLVEWLKKPGEAVKRGDVVAVVETQKGAIEIEIFEAGVLDRILVQPGEKVPVGTPDGDAAEQRRPGTGARAATAARTSAAAGAPSGAAAPERPYQPPPERPLHQCRPRCRPRPPSRRSRFPSPKRVVAFGSA